MHTLVSSDRYHVTEVMRLVITGLRNKDIASALGTSEQTIKAHRTQVMRKMQATAVAVLVRMVALLETGASQTAQRVLITSPG